MRGAGPQSAPAFSLIEVTLAIGLIAFAAIALYGLLPTAIATIESGIREETATEILYSAAADMRRVRIPSANSPLYQFSPLAASPTAISRFFDTSGTLLSGSTNAMFRLDVTPCTNSNPRFSVWRLTVSWPAQATSPNISAENIVFLIRP